MSRYAELLDGIARAGNTRCLPGDADRSLVDMSSNDYLGLGADTRLRREFLASAASGDLGMTSSASRILGAVQSPYRSLEQKLTTLYHREATVLFNSGYHANTGLIQALAISGTHIVADRLVHASIIDGMRLSGAPFSRARHGDYAHLRRLVDNALRGGAERVLLVAESIYSMDGDSADIEALVDIKRAHEPGQVVLYVDEAHAIGCAGPMGLGLVAASPAAAEVDIVVGTFGKALASVGAYATMTDRTLADYIVNTARSLIFSTALPPLNIAWTEYMLDMATLMDERRQRLRDISSRVTSAVNELTGSRLSVSHIIPVTIGDPHRAVALSQAIARHGFKVLPIRTPTVPPGTDRLRVSLSAALTDSQVDRFISVLHKVLK